VRAPDGSGNIRPDFIPILASLAPARTFPNRMAGIITDRFNSIELPRPFIDAESHEMGEVVIGPTIDRSVVGTINEFIFMADN